MSLLPVIHTQEHVREAVRAHGRLMDSGLKALLAAPDRDRKNVVYGLALLVDTPRESLARRLIDLAPPRDRALLREQLL